MKVSGQLRAPDALPPGKNTRYPLDRRLVGPQSRSDSYGVELNFNNSIRVYLRTNLRAQKPITKLAGVHRNTDITKKQNTNKTVYITALN
jgi:hypothetical protein